MTRITRRRLLQGSGAGLTTVVAGCTGGGGGGDGGTTATTTAGTTTTGGDGGGGESNAEIHVLTDYSSQPWQQKWNEQIKPGFEEQYDSPLKIEFAGMQGTGENRLTTLIQSGNPPEMFHGTITQVADLIARGQTIPVDDIVAELEEANGTMLNRSSITTGGEAHILPHGLYLGGTLNYRQDVYDALGLSVPTTWAELIHNAKVIHESDEVSAAGFAVPAQPAGKPGSDFSNWLYNAGGGYWKWADDDQTEVELWFDEEHVTAALETIRELAKYSPDPSSLNWAPTIKFWAGGRVAQCFMNNAWLAGPAYRAGVTQVALNTRQALIPKREGSDPIDRGWALIDGTPILRGSDNHEGAKNLVRYMYGSPGKQADKNLVEPMRFLPPYRDVVDADAYRNAEIFQAEDGHFLELNRSCVEDIAPHLGSTERPSTTASLYAGRFSIDSQMVNAVVVQGRPIQEAYEEAREKYQTRLAEGKEL